jgi:hypothetical protein
MELLFKKLSIPTGHDEDLTEEVCSRLVEPLGFKDLRIEVSKASPKREFFSESTREAFANLTNQPQQQPPLISSSALQQQEQQRFSLLPTVLSFFIFFSFFGHFFCQ